MRKNQYNLINRMDNVMETIIMCPGVRIDKSEYCLQEIENLFNDVLRFDHKSETIETVHQKINNLLANLLTRNIIKNIDQNFIDNISKSQLQSPVMALQVLRQTFYKQLLSEYQQRLKTETGFTTEELLRIEYNLGEIELPGQYEIELNHTQLKEFKGDKRIFIQSVDKTIQLKYDGQKLVRHIVFNGSNCKSYLYKIDNLYEPESENPNLQQSPQMKYLLTSQLVEILNSHYKLHKETYIRNLKTFCPLKFWIHRQTFLIPISPRAKSLNSLLNQYYLQNLADPEQTYVDTFNQHFNYMTDDNLKNGQFTVVINKNMKEQFPSSYLTNHVLNTVNNYEEYLELRKELCQNYSCTMFTSYLSGNIPNLNTIYLNLNSGQFYLEQFKFFQYSQDYFLNQSVMKNQKFIEFSVRLSRNIIELFGQISLYGIFASSFVSQAMSLLVEK